MKKILAVLALLVVAGAGALYWLGGHTERLFRAEMAASSMGAGSGVSMVVTDYRRGLFGAHARICVHVDEKIGNFPPRLADVMNHACMFTDLRYGPLLFGPDGIRTAWAGWRTVLDMTAWPKALRKIAKTLFGDAPPMVDTGRFAFDGSVHEHLEITPFDRKVGQLHLKLGALSINTVENRAGDGNSDGQGYMTLKTLRVDGPKGSVAIDGIDGDVAVKGMAMPGLPLMTATFAANGMTFSKGGKPLLSGNLTMRIGNHVDSGLMDANYGVWFDGLHGPLLTLPVNSGYLGVQDRGLSVQGLKIMNTEAKRLNVLERQILAAGGKSDADSVVRVTDAQQQLRRQVGRIEQALLDQVLQPDKTAISLQLLLNRDGQRQLTLTSDVHYRGVDGKSPALAKLAAMGPPGWLRLVNAGFRLDAAPAVLPPALNMRMPVFVKAGLVTTGPEGRINSDLTLNDGTLTVNGRVSTAGQLARALSGTAAR